MSFVSYAGNILRQLHDELTLPREQRQTGASDEQLRWARQYVEKMITTVQNRHLPSPEHRKLGLGYFVIDWGWNHRAPLSNTLAELEDLYERL